MRVLALIHGPLVRPELFGEAVREQGHELVEWTLPTQGPPPDDGFDAVMVFGGRMNVGEEAEHPWLEDEYELLRAWVREEKPLLGVCLGAQTLAHATGGRVGRAPLWRAGFYEVELSDEGLDDPVLGRLPERFEALLANAYEFEPAPGVTRLAATDGQQQAYRVGSRAWGVQFHPEVHRPSVLSWFGDDQPAGLESEVRAKLPGWRPLGTALFRAFLQQASQRR
jgi:GMP synthase-like glutamine amidotransferase